MGCCCGPKAKKIRYVCADECGCPAHEFDKEPKETPMCCGKTMKKA